DKIKGYIDAAKRDPGVKVLFGGGTSDTDGYFIEPTVLEAQDPAYRTMCEEIFGPVLSVHVYPAARWAETRRRVDQTSQRLSPAGRGVDVDRQDRSEDLLAHRAIRRILGFEDGGLDEVAVRVAGAPAEQDLDAGVSLRRVDVALDLVERLPVDHRPHEVPKVRRVSHFHLGEQREHPISDLGPEGVGDVGARRGAAFLPLVLEGAAHHACREHIRVRTR